MKELLFDTEQRKKILTGIKTQASAIKPTIGPKGMNVTIERPFQKPQITNDGLTIAKEITLEDKYENIGAGFILEVAEKTDSRASGGRSTGVTVAEELAILGNKYIESGTNEVSFNEGMQLALDEVIPQLKKGAKKITTNEQIAQIATISSESPEIGNKIAEVIKEVGPEGVITVETSGENGISHTKVEGMEFDKGFISPLFMTNNRQEAVLNNCLVLLTDKSISGLNEMVEFFEKLYAQGERNILIIADEVKDMALGIAVEQRMRGLCNVVCVKAPEWGDHKKKVLEDLAVLTGANVITAESQHKLGNISIENLGRIGKAIVTKDKTTIINGAGADQISDYVKYLKETMAEEKDEVEKFRIKRRIAKLTNGIAVIHVGAPTEERANYLKQKTEDGVSDAQSAIEEGIVLGGGVALAKLKLNTKIEDDEVRIGYEAVKKALEKPFRQIVINTRKINDSVALNEILKGKKNSGYDAKNNVFVDDMFEAGIIDSLKSTRILVENAISMTQSFLTSHCTIVNKEEPKEVRV